MKTLVHFKVLFGIFGGAIAYLLGGWDVLLQTFCVLVVCDFVSGIFKAIHQKCLSAKICADGIMKKVVYFIVITVAVACNRLMPDVGLREMIITFFIANEGISIVENASDFINLPKKFTQFFHDLGGDDDEE